jgi:hypothetical protein
LGSEISALNAQEDINNKLKKCQDMCATITRILKKKTQKGTWLKFYKTTAMTCLTYEYGGQELLTLRRTDERRWKAAKTPVLLSAAGYTVRDKEMGDGIRTQ